MRTLGLADGLHGQFRRPLIDGLNISRVQKQKLEVLKPVVQLERTGCGIASVATLAGVSYREMQRTANRLGIAADDPRLWSETGYVRRLLEEHGLRSASAEVPFTSWESLPDLALLAIKWHRKRGRSFWHWAAFWGDGMDQSYSTQSGPFVVMCAPTSAASSRNGSFLFVRHR